jgi:hypothetical protein
MAYFNEDTNKSFKIYTTSDSGNTWGLVSSGGSFTGGAVYGIGSQNDKYYFVPYFASSLYVMTSGGTITNPTYVNAYTFVPIPGSSVDFAAKDGIVYKSTDGGTTYGSSILSAGTPLISFLYGNGVLFISCVDTTVSPYGQKHYYSNDLGGSWTQVTTPLLSTSNSTGGAGCFANGYFHVWFPNVSTSNGFVYAKSTNGSSWTTPTALIPGSGLSAYTCIGIAGHGNQPGVVYANGTFYSTGNGSSLTKSTDGVNWSLALANLSGLTLASCCAVSDGIIGIFGDNSGIATSVTIAKTSFSTTSWTTKATISIGGGIMYALAEYDALRSLNSG